MYIYIIINTIISGVVEMLLTAIANSVQFAVYSTYLVFNTIISPKKFTY